MSELTLAQNPKIQRARMLCLLSLCLLIIICVAWEWFLAPARSGGSWLILKAIPLVLILPGILKGKRYTYQYSSMLILFYFTEGVMRSFDGLLISQICAFFEVGLSLLFFLTCLQFCRQTR